MGIPAEVMRVKHRFTNFAWLPVRDQAIATELDRDRRWRTTTLVDLTKPKESRKSPLRPERPIKPTTIPVPP